MLQLGYLFLTYFISIKILKKSINIKIIMWLKYVEYIYSLHNWHFKCENIKIIFLQNYILQNYIFTKLYFYKIILL